MSSLYVIETNESKQWDELVKGFKLYDVYYDFGYLSAFQLHGDGIPTLFYFDNGKTKAINVTMKRDIAKSGHFGDLLPESKYYDLATPYGYGGFLIEGEDYDDVEQAYSDYCLRNGIISEFVRFHPLLNNATVGSNIYEITDLGKTVHIDLRKRDLIWSNFTGKNRNVIRKAKKLGVQVYWGRSPELYEEFQELYNRTMDAQNAKPYYYFEPEFYDSVLHDLKNNSMIFYATHESKIIAMAIILFCNKQMHYHLSGSDINYRNYAATNLILYEAALWGNSNGFRTFHLGGGLGSTEDSLYKFKKAFNKNEENTFSIGKKVFNEEVYQELVELRKGQSNFYVNADFFPIYRY